MLILGAALISPAAWAQTPTAPATPGVDSPVAPSPTPSPTADSSTWPVFTPSVGLFSISYPRDWFVHEGDAISFSTSAASSRDVSIMRDQPTLALMRGDLAAADGLPPERALRTWLQALSDNWDRPDVTVDWEAKVGARRPEPRTWPPWTGSAGSPSVCT